MTTIALWMRVFLLGCLLGLPAAALAQWSRTGPQVELKVSLPRQGLQSEPVTIGIEYTIDTSLPPGRAVVTYHNVDTGEDFVRTLDIPLSQGRHRTEAVWQPEDTLPSGMYVTTVVLADADGKELARYATSPDRVQSLMITGGATRMLNLETVLAGLDDLTRWREELEGLEAAARAAGADTTRQKLLIVVLQEMAFWSQENVKFKRFDRIDANHQYLAPAVAEAKADLKKLAQDPDAFSAIRAPAIPRPEERLTIRDGGWYAGDQQVFLSGPCFFNFTIRYLPVARDLGFNVIQVSTGPSSIFETSAEATGVPRITDYNERIRTGALVEVLDQCAKFGIKVDLGLTSHFMPKWVYEQWPDAKNQFVLWDMMPYDIEHPEVLNLIQRFYEIVMPQIAGHPALNSIWVANEPEYMNPNERNMAIFQPWLQAKYGTIDALNKAWGTALEAFEEIRASGKRGNPVPDAVSTDAARLDWWTYSTERLVRHFQWQKDLIHRYDPDLPITVKLYNGTFNPQFKPMSRADEESSFRIMDYMGISGGSYPFSKPYKDFLRSHDPAKPLANLEYKFGSPAARTQLDFWQEAMQGVTHINWWCWHPNPAFSPVPTSAQSMHQAALAKLDIQRLLPQIRAFHRQPAAPLAVLYPDPVSPRYREYFGFNDPTNRALTLMGLSVDYASEDRVAEGRLDDYQVLVLPAANFIRDTTYASVQAFVERGGTAIVLGALPDQNEYNQPRDVSFFQPRGDVRTWPLQHAQAVAFSAGQGRIYHLPEVPRSTDGRRHLTAASAALIEDFLERTLAETLPPPPVVIRDATGRPFIENRTVAFAPEGGAQVHLTYVVHDGVDGEQVVEPTFNAPVTSVRDLITGESLDPARIVMPPASVRLLEFTVAP